MAPALLRIRSIAHGGAGVGRPEDAEGPTWFVPGALPGERVEAEPERTAKRHVHGRLVRVVEPASARVVAPCSLAEVCGGCAWQHVDVRDQGELKRTIVRDQLRAVLDPAAKVGLVRSPQALGYRRRARAHWQREGDELVLGFHRVRSHEVVDVPACPVLAPPLVHALTRFREAAAVLPERGEVLVATDEKVAILGLPGVRPERATMVVLEALLDDVLVGIEARGGRRRAVVGRALLELDEGGGLPAVPASAFVFAQAQARGNRALVEHVTRMARAEGRRVLELYAGAGNLTRALARKAKRVWASDADREAVHLLSLMVERTRLPVNVKHGEATRLVARIAAGESRYEVVVLDPPREGLGETASRALATVATERIVYVSCDPATLARDLRMLVREGWELADVTVLDLMPMTAEVETVATLVRRRGAP